MNRYESTPSLRSNPPVTLSRSFDAVDTNADSENGADQFGMDINDAFRQLSDAYRGNSELGPNLNLNRGCSGYFDDEEEFYRYEGNDMRFEENTDNQGDGIIQNQEESVGFNQPEENIRRGGNRTTSTPERERGKKRRTIQKVEKKDTDDSDGEGSFGNSKEDSSEENNVSSGYDEESIEKCREGTALKSTEESDESKNDESDDDKPIKKTNTSARTKSNTYGKRTKRNGGSKGSGNTTKGDGDKTSTSVAGRRTVRRDEPVVSVDDATPPKDDPKDRSAASSVGPLGLGSIALSIVAFLFF